MSDGIANRDRGIEHSASAPHMQSGDILAVHSGALGDLILFGRLIERLGQSTTLAAGWEKCLLLAGLGVVARTLDFDAMPMHEVFTDKPLEQCRLPALLGQHERLISCFGGEDRLSELRLAGMCQAGSAAFLPVRPPEEYAGHLLELWSDLLGLTTLESLAVPAWPVPQEWRDEASKATQRQADEYVVIHPGAGGIAKCWPLEKFMELAGLIGPERCMFILGPAELERWPAGHVAILREKFTVIAAPPIQLLTGILAGAIACVGNDSGVSHLSAAVGAPTLAIFGPTNPTHFAPLGPRVKIIQSGNLPHLPAVEIYEAVMSLQRGSSTE